MMETVSTTKVTQNLPTQRLQQLNDTKRFLNSQNPLMLLIGELASGKTRLLSDIVLQIRSTRQMICLTGTPNLTPAHLITALSKHTTISNVDEQQRIEIQLDEMLNQIIRRDLSCVLIIDDAHLLSFSTLAAISHLVTQQDGKHVHLHIILSGLPSLTEKIGNLLTKEFQKITVGALSREESFRKIKHMLDSAGLHLPPAPANAIFSKLYKRSAGMPETLEAMVRKLLSQRTASETSTAITSKIAAFAPKGFWRSHRIKSFSFLALIVFGYLFWGWQHHRISFLEHHHTPAISKNLTPTPTPILLHQQVTPSIHTEQAQKVHAIAVAPPKSPYTLQLMSGLNLKAMAQFIQQHHLTESSQIMKTEYKGHDWYVLTYGNYDDSKLAQAALTTLPESLQSHHPWVRSTKQLTPIGRKPLMRLK